MEAFDVYLNNLVNKNKNSRFGSSPVKWLNEYADYELTDSRNSLVDNKLNSWLFENTKPYYNHVSPGCKICGEGKWSCLFVTNKCNANCFYCPAAQLNDEVPGTQGFDFGRAEDYAQYVKYFGFKGVAFSGGEPLLYFDRTLEYLKQVRKIASPDVYIWMYTNGIMADKDKMHQLADNGLDEIRFDIGADGYKLEKIKLAKSVIPAITVEIPAVPEEYEKIIRLLPEMADAGVTNLNLHQLRLTEYNAARLLKHNYTYIPAERPVVLESEIAALKILSYARENSLPIGINYCSFFFKNRFQKAGFRKQIALAMGVLSENITQNGYVRIMDGNMLLYKTYILKETDFPGASKFLAGEKPYFAKQENAINPIDLNSENRDCINGLINFKSHGIPADDFLFGIWQMEYIEKGLR